MDPASARQGNHETGAERGAHGRLPIHLQGVFGRDRFGRLAERFARFFGTPRFIVGQTVAVAVWIALNAAALGLSWDPYPFILLNLAFSTQAAYAAPLILLAQTRQADRDKAHSVAADAQHDHAAAMQERMLAENTRLIREVERLTEQIYRATTFGSSPNKPGE
jgi:uncharacterized membrane protein